jgi:hypothetical protein
LGTKKTATSKGFTQYRKTNKGKNILGSHPQRGGICNRPPPVGGDKKKKPQIGYNLLFPSGEGIYGKTIFARFGLSLTSTGRVFTKKVP